MVSDIVGWNQRNRQIIKEAYAEIMDIQKRIDWVNLVDLQRMHPKLWSAWCDLEEKIESRADLMVYNDYMAWKVEALKIWNRLEGYVNQELEEMMARGMARPAPVQNPWALTFIQDRRKPTDICEVGYVTQEELDLYFQKKITVRELQLKNLQKREESSLLMGPVGLGQDGTGKKRLSEVVPALQKSTQLAPDANENKQCIRVHEQKKNDTVVGIEMELVDENTDDNLLELGEVKEAWMD